MPHCTDKNTLEYHTVAGNCETNDICKKGGYAWAYFFDGNDDAVEEEYAKAKNIFDVFGFSRGAIQAPHIAGQSL